MSGIVIYVFSKYCNDNLTLLQIVGIFLVVHTIYEAKDMLCYSEYFHIFHGKNLSNIPGANNSFLNTIGDTLGGLLGVLVSPYIFTSMTPETVVMVAIAYIVLYLLLQPVG